MLKFELPENIGSEMTNLTDAVRAENMIETELFKKFAVKRGLRDLDGRGVLVGLTKIGEVHSYIVDEGEPIPVPGQLFYRGYDVEELAKGFLKDDRFGFEETCYLLLFGELPTPDELASFNRLLGSCRKLPDLFTKDIILEHPSRDMMNALARSVLALYSFDSNPDNTSVPNLLQQCIKLISCFPALAIYGYQAFSHYHEGKSLVIHSPLPELSTAENILHMLRPDSKYTRLEATLLDLALVLHAEHGGGNNSTFVTHVVTSTGTDTYSAIASALGSLKGPRHGGANIKVLQMFEDMKTSLTDWEDEEAIINYLNQILNKQAFDKSGLIYGVGHAVYSISDPRARIFHDYVKQLAQKKGLSDEYNLYAKVEQLAPEVIAKKATMYKGVSANIDFYSGFVYRMLGIPQELFTPIFAIARISGWSAHRIEEVVNNGKIIRPAYKSVAGRRDYIEIGDR